MAVPLLEAAAGLRHEAALLDRVIEGTVDWGAVFWRSSRPAIVVPHAVTRWRNFAAAAEAMTAQGWPVVLRASGGGVVPQVPGFLNVAIGYRAQPSPSFDIDAAYRQLCAPLIEALARLGVDARCGKVAGALCDGAFNLVVDGRKLAGTAQRWRALPGGTGRFAVLAEAVILCRADLDALCAAVNEFYRRCGLSSRVAAERHVTLAQLRPAPAGDAGADGMIGSLVTEVAAALRRAGFSVAG